ncbi:hypothetical protein RRG08_056966 [Elysia crispata]|uniref:Uncharacterized protein n=1 Tax=Elysia crispata TaxID=231223 RepID=A0AAE1AKC3_9GAST|nr:hypothetical protein RRG08_056966 [Elysia crispata]
MFSLQVIFLLSLFLDPVSCQGLLEGTKVVAKRSRDEAATQSSTENEAATQSSTKGLLEGTKVVAKLSRGDQGKAVFFKIYGCSRVFDDCQVQVPQNISLLNCGDFTEFVQCFITQCSKIKGKYAAKQTATPMVQFAKDEFHCVWYSMSFVVSLVQYAKDEFHCEIGADEVSNEGNSSSVARASAWGSLCALVVAFLAKFFSA